ncbi:MAG: MMPL family transporter [Clostridia bacterium]
MKKLAKFIVKRYKILLVVFVVLTILSCVALPTVFKRVNSDLTSYLPKGTMTSDGQKFLKDNFGIEADVIVGVKGATSDEIYNICGKISNLTKNGKNIVVSDTALEPEDKAVATCLWKDSEFFLGLKLLLALGEKYPDGSPYNPSYIDNIMFSNNGTADIDTDDTYVLMITLNFGPSSSESFDTIDAIEDIIEQENSSAECYIGGSTQLAKTIFESTLDEVWKYSIAGVVIVLVILFMFTKSWIDPIILLATLGISIILNLGSNIILPSTSIITFSASAILQLALAMDYAVFFLHAYRTEKRTTLDPFEALEKTIPRTFNAVFSSALTTVGGFIALFFMRFTIGMDLGLVLAKGIGLSFLTVIFFQPVLVILLRNKMETWQHKSIDLKFKKPVKGIIKYRTVVVVGLLIAIFPAVLLQSNLGYGYFNFVKEVPKEGALYDKVDTLANQLVISVPIDLDSEESMTTHYIFIEELRGLKNPDGSPAVSFMLGLNALLPKEALEGPMGGAIKSQSGQYVNNGYGMYTVGMTNSNIESDDMFKTINDIQALIAKHFPGQDYYVTGMAQAAKDFAFITPTDFNRVSIASVLIIIVIMIFSFKSLKHSLILMLIIQFGIWVNLAIQKLIGHQINFMSYIIISSIQMGGTVDYAILVTTKYREFRKKLMPPQAAYQATTSSIMSILTSSSILAAACFCVYLMTSNLIVAEITMLIARGAIISAVLVIFVLPAVLTFMDRPFLKNAMKKPPKDSSGKRIKKERALEDIDADYTDVDNEPNCGYDAKTLATEPSIEGEGAPISDDVCEQTAVVNEQEEVDK